VQFGVPAVAVGERVEQLLVGQIAPAVRGLRAPAQRPRPLGPVDRVQAGVDGGAAGAGQGGVRGLIGLPGLIDAGLRLLALDPAAFGRARRARGGHGDLLGVPDRLGRVGGPLLRLPCLVRGVPGQPGRDLPGPADAAGQRQPGQGDDGGEQEQQPDGDDRIHERSL
jgi:hypothetical protein